MPPTFRARRHLKIAFIDVDGPNIMGDNPLLAGIDIPLGVASLQAYLRSQRDLKGAFSCTGRAYPFSRGTKTVAAEVVASKPDIVAFGAFLWNLPRSMDVAKRIKALRPETFLVFGGPCVPLRASEARRFMDERPFLDAAVSGEGEFVFADIVRARRAGKTLEGVSGTAWRDGDGVIVNDPRPPYADLSVLPSPLLGRTAKIIQPKLRGIPVIPIETSRGCPLTCTFCDFHRGRKAFQPFPLKRVRAEIDMIVRSGFRGVTYVSDSCANANLKHFKEVLKAGQKIDNLYFNPHGEMFDEESLDLMERLPHFSMAVGVQSVNPAAMRRIRRSCDIAKITRNISRLTRMKNLDLSIDIIVGIPGDDYEGFKRTIDWALALDPIPTLSIHHFGVPIDSPIARTAARDGVVVNESGFATRTDGFGPKDFLRASRLCRVLAYFQGSPDRRAELAERLARSKRRPSQVIEAVVDEALRTGQMPAAPVGAFAYTWPASAKLRLKA